MHTIELSSTALVPLQRMERRTLMETAWLGFFPLVCKTVAIIKIIYTSLSGAHGNKMSYVDQNITRKVCVTLWL